MKEFAKKYLYNYYFLCIAAAFFINFSIECFSRHSIVAALQYLIHSPIIFTYNVLLILVTLSVVLLVRRKLFVFTTISVIWLAGGITNGIVLNNRVTPFTANELKLISSTFDILEKYFTKFEIGLIIVGISIAIIGVIISFFKAPKSKNKVNYKKAIPLFAASVLSFVLLTQGALKANIISDYFGNVAFAYLDYGFPYCFTNTLLNTGIKRPINYTKANVDQLAQSLVAADESPELDSSNLVASNDNTLVPQKQAPNIIMLQLESFFDPTYMKDLEFSEDPIPNFTKLKEEFSSGFLRVPSVGAGTANTEFEIITGMNLEFFGAGEYPYKTILRKTTAESLNFDLKDLGYSTHAIHNNKGTFYTRQKVFKMLGFDTFTSIEYMNIEETTPLGWAKDKYLTKPILDALNSTEGQDFIYTISVQGHGDYPSTPIENHSKITVSGLDNVDRLTSFEYFTNEVYEMDRFVGELINALSLINENTVLIMYGDHLPTLGIEDAELSNGDIFQTEYVIWNNFGLEKQDADIEAYQLGAHVLNQLDIHHGTLINYHQQHQESADYLDNLKLLQYDMLYGERYIYGGMTPYEPTKMQMGVNEILISDVYNDDEGNLIVKGQNFTDYSRVKINDSAHETTYIDPTTLKLSDYTLNETDTFAIQQVTVTNHVLSTSAKFSLSQDEDNPLYDQGFEEGYIAGYQAAIEALKQQTGEIVE
ncbi:MAG: sulfatase-like hydrolase/transferase [Turicibacter sp.]|nr:sulfatase-like hydrolase/transferase [Turicibacter sp.]